MSVPKRPFPMAKIPAAPPPAAAEPPVRSSPPPPIGPPQWLNGLTIEEHAYRVAVEKSFRKPQPEREEDPHSWVWG
jgi:hypothetical protein